MGEDLGKLDLPKALNRCTKCNKSPNLVTLKVTDIGTGYPYVRGMYPEIRKYLPGSNDQ